MHPSRPLLPKLLGITLTLSALAAVFILKASQNYRTQHPTNSNFYSFWLAGHMAWTGESPYDASQWKAGFDAVNATYRPSRILQYPLPLMYFMAPIGWLPPAQAYFAWLLATQAILAFTIYVLLGSQPGRRRLFLPVTIFLLFFGPVFLTLQIGSVGAIALLAITLGIMLLKRNQPLWAGVAFSVLALKPPQAVPLFILLLVWFVARRQWRALAGIAIGGLLLLAVWVLRDPLWLIKFRASSDFLLGHSTGIQSNVYSGAFLACKGNLNCMWWLGSASALLVLALGSYLLWRNRADWTDWQAINIMLPMGFVCAVYLYSYDQLLYVIPIVWIVAMLLDRTRSYLASFLFLVLIDAVAFGALLAEADTQHDYWSLLTTLLVFGTCIWLSSVGAKSSVDAVTKAADVS